MDRRSFIRSAGLAGAGAATTLAAPAIAQERIEWSMVTTWPAGFPGLGVGAARFAERVGQMSDGRLTIQVYGAGELVPPFESFDAVAEGTAQIMHATPYYWQGNHPAINFFTSAPYAMLASEHNAWIEYGGGQELWDEVYDQFGLKGWSSGNTGTQMAGWFPNPIESLDDLQGLSFRTAGLGGEVWRRIGLNVQTMPAGEIFAALQSGALDAAEFVGPYNDLALGFYQVCKHYYLSSFNEPGLATELAVDKAKFAALPADLQLIVEIACQAEYDQVASDFYANDPVALNTLVTEHGVITHTFPDDILEAGALAAVEILEGLRNSDDAMTKKITESYLTSLAQVRTRTEGTDMPYIRAREAFFHPG
jgi:TRAP-type mannitol/chloroaromatic compound transport system substrate-binding protein